MDYLLQCRLGPPLYSLIQQCHHILISCLSVNVSHLISLSDYLLIALPPFCSIPHRLSPLDSTWWCCINCSLCINISTKKNNHSLSFLFLWLKKVTYNTLNDMFPRPPPRQNQLINYDKPLEK